MNENARLRAAFRTLTALLAAALALLLAGAAAAEERHTVLLPCAGAGYVGWDKAGKSDAVLVPEREVKVEKLLPSELWMISLTLPNP